MSPTSPPSKLSNHLSLFVDDHLAEQSRVPGVVLGSRPAEAASPSATVQLHALAAGHFTLPEEQFVSPASHQGRKRVPSLCFLIQHESPATGETTRILFDLGLRRNVERYPDPIRRHVETRRPLTTDPDVVKSLRAGGLTPNQIDYVLYSHVHWDHVGEPRDFPRSIFVVGHGSLGLLRGTSSHLRGGHSFFEADLLDPLRTVELPDPETETTGRQGAQLHNTLDRSWSRPVDFSGPWRPLNHDIPSALDIFGDGSVFIIDAPGHLPGHINLLARTRHGNGGGVRWVYLAGDACHDRRIMRGEKQMGEWIDPHGQVCCIHADRAKAEEIIERIRKLEARGVEVILAHDVEWEGDEKNRARFFGSTDTGR